MTLHFVLIFKSKNNQNEYAVVPSTMAGEDVFERKEAAIEVYARSWRNDWELICAKEKIEPGDWSKNLNCQTFSLLAEDDSLFERPINFEKIAKLHPILEFFL